MARTGSPSRSDVVVAVAALSAALAAMLWVAAGSSSQLRRLRPLGAETRSSGTTHRRWLAAGAVPCGAVAGATLVDGSRGLAVALVVACVIVTAGLVVRRRLARRSELRRMKEVARAGEVLSSLVAIGHVPTAALAHAAMDCNVLAHAAAIQQIGGDPMQALRVAGQQRGNGGLVTVARAWEVSAVTGAPVASALSAVTDQLRATTDLAHVVDAELAAPRATGQLLALLPCAGLGMGLALGGDPLGFLTGSIGGQICLVLGFGLAAAGVLWSEALADRAAAVVGH